MDPPHYTSEAPPASSINIKSSFVSQDALDQSRARREEEWKRAHANADNPPPMPEEPYDPRTLYERLKEQRDRKEADFEEATRLGNLVHRLDNEEANFLDEMVEERKKKERALEEEEKAALAQFRSELTEARDTSPSPSVKAQSHKEGVNDRPMKRLRSKEPSKRDAWCLSTRKEADLSRIVTVKKSRLIVPSSSTSPASSTSPGKGKDEGEARKKVKVSKEEAKEPPKPSIGLVQYGSDEDSD